MNFLDVGYFEEKENNLIDLIFEIRYNIYNNIKI